MIKTESEPLPLALHQPTAVAPGQGDWPSRWIPLATWLVAVILMAWIPFKILSYGYLPPDDALRHVAKAVTQRPWSEILVLRPDFQTDHNPGWHWMLARVHQWTQLPP